MPGARREDLIMAYGTSITVNTAFAPMLQRVRDELRAEGFGVLTEIDVASTMADKLDERMEEYVILGACNPPLAHQALQADRSVGLLLPCNIVVRQAEGATVVEALDPHVMSTLSGADGLAAPAEDAAARLNRVMERLVTNDPTQAMPVGDKNRGQGKETSVCAIR
jgi:uncharacterized protein (DUF302 family)